MKELLPCKCGDRATVEIHDNSWWISCSCTSWKHDAEDCPEVGGCDGYPTYEEAAAAWNELMS